MIGEILSLGQSTPYKYEFDIGENQKITKEDPLLKQIGAKLRLKAEVKQGKPYYKDKEIKIASPIEFKTSKYNLLIVPFEIKRERIIDLFVTLIDLGEGLLKEISVGDKELDKNGDTIVEILSLGKVENSYTAFDLGGGKLIKAEHSNKKQISSKMRLKCQVRDNNHLYFKGRKVEYNMPFEFETDEYKIRGLSSEDYKPFLKEKWLVIQVKFSQVIPEMAKVVQKGDIGKDAFGNTIAKIGSIISNEAALVTTVDERDDKFITLRHPFDRDIRVTLEVLCVEREGAYYFKDDLIKMGKNITFNTDLYSITGLITGIELK